MKKNFNESTNNDSESICSIGGKKKCVTLSTRNCSSKNHEYFSNVSFHFFHFFMWNRAVCIICPSNELEMVAKAMLFSDHHFRESALHMNIDTPFVYTFWNSWCGCVSVFLRRNSSESKKREDLNSVPTVISWHRFLHAKIMWISMILCLWNALTLAGRSVTFCRRSFSFFSLAARVQVTKATWKRGLHHHLFASYKALCITLCASYAPLKPEIFA